MSIGGACSGSSFSYATRVPRASLSPCADRLGLDTERPERGQSLTLRGNREERHGRAIALERVDQERREVSRSHVVFAVATLAA